MIRELVATTPRPHAAILIMTAHARSERYRGDEAGRARLSAEPFEVDELPWWFGARWNISD